MELTDYLQILRKYWAGIVALTLLGVAAAAGYSLLVPPTYSASTSLYLTVQSGASAGELAQGSTYTERQVKSFAEVAGAPIVLQPVIDRLDLKTTPMDLAKNLTLRVPTNTAILTITVEDNDPNRAAVIAGAIGEELVRTVDQVAPKDSAGQASVVATVISPATVPTEWTSPKVVQALALGLLVGLFIGLAQALLRHVLDTKVRTVDHIATITDLPVVGTIAWNARVGGTDPVLLSAPTSASAEEFRRLRTNMQFLGVQDGRNTIAFTSSIAGEGKTTTVINVALAMAAAGRRVLLVDADLRRPRVAERLAIKGKVGLTTILIGRAGLADVVRTVHGLDVLPSGRVPPNPSELLGSDAMRQLLAEAAREYDYVLLDAAPLVPVADTAVLSSLVGGVIVLAASGTVHRAQLEDALEAVRGADGQVLGVVLNKVRASDAGQRRSTYGERGGYGDPPPAPTPTKRPPDRERRRPRRGKPPRQIPSAP